MLSIDLYARLERRRDALGLSVQDVLDRSGIARKTYYDLRRPGHAQLEMLVRVADALGLGLDELFQVSELAPSPEAASLARCRDLLRPDGTAHPGRFARAVDMAWRARFRDGRRLADPEAVGPGLGAAEEPVGVEVQGPGPVEPRDAGAQP